MAEPVPFRRQQTGIPRLDELLGGGLLPGTLTVVLGATGVGKSQLGLQFANAGHAQEGERGVIFDLTARGDSQNHAAYARRMFGWALAEQPADGGPRPEQVWDREWARRDYCHLFARTGRRVTAGDLTTDELRLWKAELNHRLVQTIAFFYGNFIHGVRRCVIDGVEPADSPRESFQFELFEYIYHQVLRKESDWVARDLFRAQYREHASRVLEYAYDCRQVGCLLLATTHEVMLEQLLSRPLQSGDVLSNANTIVAMGKIREGLRMGRALCVLKHRGSACDESIVRFDIGDAGVRIAE
jgi:KaiC/GvpD/RAD55 family RecA-like ATPase